MPWNEYFNIAGLPPGSYRSIAGYAAESLITGRAMQCGYNLFFKAWRDSPYDGVLDHNGVLFRIEIKGSTTDSLSVTSGGRSGAQINREAEDRTHLISVEEVDFVLGVSNLNGDCYILPIDVIQIFNRQSLSFDKIVLFKEKWRIFTGYTSDGIALSTEDIRRGFLRIDLDSLITIATKLGIAIPERADVYSFEWLGFQGGYIQNLDLQKYMAIQIWKKLFS